ncbi:hypothetical protein Ancab_003213 [Ancistrocladus abbreviatus]
METTWNQLRYIPTPTRKIQFQSISRNVQNDIVSVFPFLPMRDLTLSLRRLSAAGKTFSSSTINRHLQQQRKPNPEVSSVEEMAEIEEVAMKREKQPLQPDIAERQPRKDLPPPPEKPEPGDCCGSGCVRCVWDIYYEELDAYDKLCQHYSEVQRKSEFCLNPKV